MIALNHNLPEYHDDTLFDNATRLRLFGTSALRTAILLLHKSPRSPDDDRLLVHHAHLASAYWSATNPDPHDRIGHVADLIWVQALVATRAMRDAQIVGAQLWIRSGNHASVQAPLAISLAEAALALHDGVAAEHWLHLAALIIGGLSTSRHRQTCQWQLDHLSLELRPHSCHVVS